MDFSLGRQDAIPTMPITLVTGPARSGKSEWAEQLAERWAVAARQQVVYIATAAERPDDFEWQSRIAAHRQRRPSRWQCLEVPVELARAIDHHSQTHCLLIDSLGTWLANLIEQSPQDWARSQQQLLKALAQTPAQIIIVAEETGWGIVPAFELGRTFRDRLGSLSRQIALMATAVYLVTCGYALNLKALGEAVPPCGQGKP